jgi:hypothetical protein
MIFRIPLLLAAGSAISTGAIIYSESFTTDLTNVQSISAENWAGRQSNSGSAIDVVHNSGSYRAGTVGGGNSGPPAVDDYLFAQTQSTTTAVDFFLYTTSTLSAFSSFAPSDYTALTATWNRNGDSVAGLHFTVQVGGNWYVSQSNYNSTIPGQGVTPALNLLTSTWWNLVNGATLEIGSTTSTYSDLFGSGAQITGVGFFIDNLAVSGSANRTIRLDDIVIDGVPEPSAALLSVLGLASLAARRKR